MSKKLNTEIMENDQSLNETMTTMEIELAIARRYDLRTHSVVPNISWGLGFSYELDILIVGPSGYCIEVEIKQSKSDLIADFKKEKWKHSYVGMKMVNRPKEFYYCFPQTIVDSCAVLVPKHAGIMVCSFVNGKAIITVRKFPIINRNAKPLTANEISKLRALAIHRIWRLQETLNLQLRK